MGSLHVSSVERFCSLLYYSQLDLIVNSPLAHRCDLGARQTAERLLSTPGCPFSLSRRASSSFIAWCHAIASVRARRLNLLSARSRYARTLSRLLNGRSLRASRARNFVAVAVSPIHAQLSQKQARLQCIVGALEVVPVVERRRTIGSIRPRLLGHVLG